MWVHESGLSSIPNNNRLDSLSKSSQIESHYRVWRWDDLPEGLKRAEWSTDIVVPTAVAVGPDSSTVLLLAEEGGSGDGENGEKESFEKKGGVLGDDVCDERRRQ